MEHKYLNFRIHDTTLGQSLSMKITWKRSFWTASIIELILSEKLQLPITPSYFVIYRRTRAQKKYSKHHEETSCNS